MPHARSARRRLLLFGLGVAGLFAIAVATLPHSPAALRAEVQDLGALAPLACLAGWVVLTPALVTGTLLAAATGLAFGLAAGLPLAVLGATCGGLVAFAIARRGGHGAVQELTGGRARLERVQERLERRGFVAVLVARLAPGVPTTLLNYAAGLSRIRVRDFAAGTALGGIPRITAYTAVGGSLGDPTSPIMLGALGLLAAMGLGGAAVALRIRRRAPVAA